LTRQAVRLSVRLGTPAKTDQTQRKVASREWGDYRPFRQTGASHQTMKTAYELAMERLNKDAPLKKLTDDQKARLAELDAKYAAKIAEREIFLQGELTKAQASGDFEAIEQLEQQLSSERRRLEAERDEKKEAVRNEN
jgi:hypothetical protein